MIRAGSIVAALGAACFCLPAFAAPDRIGVALIEISGAPTDCPSPLAWLAGDAAEPTMPQIVDSLYGLIDDERVGACVVRLKDAELGFTQAQEIGEAIQAVSESGKPVHVFAEGYSTVELVLASYADEAIVQSGGEVALSGMYMEELYLADTLSWIGVKADMIQVGDYKGANEQMTRSAPSTAWDQNANQLLDGLYGVMRETLKANRGLTDAQLDGAMSRLWLSDEQTQVESGLIDAAVDLAMLGDHLADRHGVPVSWIDVNPAGEGPSIDASNPFALLGTLSQAPSHEPSGPAIAIVHINGPIVDGDSTLAGVFGEQSVGSRTVRNALEEIRDQALIKGVVIRIDSPGGSAIASEVIWQGVRRLAETKPVWVSVGSMAASGGYYVAVAGDRIYVNPSSIVGSIGVVGGKFSMSSLFDTLKVRAVGRARGPNADLFSSTREWDDQTRELVRAKMAETYGLFTSRVSQGREGIDLSETAEGRLFVGEAAVGLHMADEVGSLDLAVSDMAEDLGLDEFETIDFPGPMGLDEFLSDMFGQFVLAPHVSQRAGTGPMVEVARQLIGPRAWPGVRDAAASMLQLRDEPVLLAMPRALIFK